MFREPDQESDIHPNPMALMHVIRTPFIFSSTPVVTTDTQLPQCRRPTKIAHSYLAILIVPDNLLLNFQRPLVMCQKLDNEAAILMLWAQIPPIIE